MRLSRASPKSRKKTHCVVPELLRRLIVLLIGHSYKLSRGLCWVKRWRRQRSVLYEERLDRFSLYRR
eukprot:scaffold53714_cov54-Attheya_sp.AAC.3